MTIHNRGKMKWHGAFFMPGHSKLLRDLRKNYQREGKPVLDEQQVEVFEELVCEAMEIIGSLL